MMSVSSVVAVDCGVSGHSFTISERSMLELIKEQLLAASKDGRIAKFQNQVEKQAKYRLLNPKGLEKVVPTTAPRTYYYDPSIELTKDLRNHEGELIYKKGTKANPTDVVSWGVPWVFIDGQDEEQVLFAIKTQELTGCDILLVRGSPLKLKLKHKRKFDFDQHGSYVEIFSIKQFPAIVWQQEKLLRIDEILVDINELKRIGVK